ncbi:methyltransferase [Macrophomina phaseolina]|uniref:Methyltransferase n=1 Tax=Macrophomina phaseolina TaxID=35725 RepID=A0ABQ8GP88_9PEZI|nr:methyltransferase [Macrophomina phaseolina]
MALAADNVPLEVDDGFSESDSAFCDQSSTSTSVTSSILNYKYENGRRYHAFREGTYFAPNDDKEQDRMDLFHHISTLILGGKLFRAPVPKDPRRILDFGTGTGIWAMDVADEYPNAEVVGTDLSPIQPSWVPPNCRFLVDDVEADWTDGAPYDFVHGRTMAGSVKDWPRLFGQAHANMKPGGWIELQEFEIQYGCDDGSYPAKAPTVALFIEKLNEAAEGFGKPMDVARDLKGWMADAGFTNVQDDVYKVPMAPWAKDKKLKEIGKYALIHVLEAIEAYSLALFTRVLKYTPEEVQVMMAKIRSEFKDPEVHLYWIYHITYGQKPEST